MDRNVRASCFVHLETEHELKAARKRVTSFVSDDTAESLANAIIEFHDMDKDQYIEIGTNGKKGAKDFDFGVLTDKLLTVIEQVTKYKEKIL